jgi:hypothetical protein
MLGISDDGHGCRVRFGDRVSCGEATEDAVMRSRERLAQEEQCWVEHLCLLDWVVRVV